MPTKNRTDLKSYFVKNAIPTEGNFADLIDSQLNQAQDGVFKPDGDALTVVAASGDQKRVLRLFASYPATNPDWMISLNPAQDPTKAGTNKSGFGITDGTGKTRLFIDAATGQIGVGTNTPGDILHVRNADTVGLLESSTTQAALRLATSEGTSNYVGFANRSGGNAAISVGTAGDALIVKKDGGVVVSKASGGTGVLTVENYLKFSNDWPMDKIVLWEGGPSERSGIGINDSNINLFCPSYSRFSLRQNSYNGTEVFSVSGSGDVAAQGRSLTVKGAGNEQCYLGGDGAGNDVELGSKNSNIMIVSAWNPSAGSGMDIHCRNLTQTSDARSKDNIEPIAGALERIVRLCGVSFDWKVDNRPEGAPKHLGLVAQQVREVVPEAVVDAKEGSLSITYNAITALLVEAVKEQQKHIDELRAALTPATAH
jgi:hypothetical protein